MIATKGWRPAGPGWSKRESGWRRRHRVVRALLWALIPALAASTLGCARGEESTSADGDGLTTSSGSSSTAGQGLLTDFGVDEATIRVGYNVDLSNLFSPTVVDTMTATEVYWEWVNDNGGIAGRRVQPVVLDNSYDIPAHLANHDVLSGDGPQSVVMIGQSTGSPQTAATADDLVEDQMAAIPLSWYSGWADPRIGANVFEVQANYCLESMNGLTYLSEQYGEKVAIVSMPGEYGQDGAQGAKHAAQELGLQLVYDGEGQVAPEGDLQSVIDKIVESEADVVWVTVLSSSLADLIEGAVDQGFTGMWSGNSPSYDISLLDTDLADALDEYYVHSTYTALWNTGNAPAMAEMVTQMRQRRPDAPISDVYILGWVNGMIVQQTLERAAINGDLTRAGVLAAANQITADLGGLAPNQTWAGTPNDYVVRQTYLYDVDVTQYTPGATVSDEQAGLGLQHLKGPFASPTATNYDFQGACFSD
jgi:ABC-type branched-subunit amino acid transport system substrate-binding protein